MGRTRRAATMQDAADRAGVSLATVSFVVNGTKPITAATRERVEAAMQDLGFRRNAMARALASRQSHIIALLYPTAELNFGGTGVEFLTTAAERALELGYTLVVWPMNDTTSTVAELTSTGLVDGVLLMEVRLDDARVAELTEGTVPFALIGRTRSLDDLIYVDVDFEKAVSEAVDYLVAHGHSRIALLSSDHETVRPGYGPAVRTREHFVGEMARCGLPSEVLTCAPNPIAGREAGARFAASDDRATAVIIQNEHAAPGFASGVQKCGLVIPKDLSLTSIASTPRMAAMAYPPLTLWEVPARGLSRQGVEALIERIEHPHSTGRQRLLPCTFVGGDSVAPASR